MGEERDNISKYQSFIVLANLTRLTHDRCSTTPLGLSKKGCVCVCHLRIQLGNLGSLLLTGSITEALRDPCKLPLFGSWSSLPSSRPTDIAARGPCVLYMSACVIYVCVRRLCACVYQQKETAGVDEIL